MLADPDARTSTRRAAACVMLIAPFLLLVISYHSRPAKIPVLRNASGHWIRFAPKAAFPVFRVPAMNLTHGLIAAVMLSHAADFNNAERRVAYTNLLSTLLFTIAIKSDFEAMGLSLPAGPALLQHTAPRLGVATVATLVFGLGLALVRSRGVPPPWPELRLRNRDWAAIAGLLGAYIVIVIVPIFGSHRF